MNNHNKISTLQKPERLQESEIMTILLHHAMESEYAFVLWKLPNLSTKNLTLSFTPAPFTVFNTIEDLPEGFLFAPFGDEKPGNFLKTDLSFSFDEGKLNEPTTPVQSSSHEWFREAEKKIQSKQPKLFYNPQYKKGAVVTEPNFKELIQQSVTKIEAGEFEKIVPSRKKEIELPGSFDVVEAFQKLCAAYPNAMISLISIPGIGTWLGATPELLVSVEEKTIFRTVALAGTKAFEPGTNLKQVAWTQKEIEEQALVSRYIINNFKKIRLREFEEHGPKTVVAGNLMHLKTEFSVDMKATNFPQLGSVMLQLLHPTSAVCGMPLEASHKFLQEHEGYDREYYSGYLGPVNTQRNTHIFVNLRCMQVLEKKAVVYAGAGVTVDSDPQTEWEETEMKLNTLLNVIL